MGLYGPVERLPAFPDHVDLIEIARVARALEGKLTETQIADLKRLIEDWLREWPTSVLETPADAWSLGGSPTSAYVTLCAQRQLALLERVIPALNLEVKPAQKIRLIGLAWIPLRNPSE